MPYTHVAIRIIKDGKLFGTYRPSRAVGIGFLLDKAQEFVTSIHAEKNVTAIIYSTRTLKEIKKITKWMKEKDEGS